MKENYSFRELQHPVFGAVRTALSASNEPLFRASDVTRALGYANSTNH